MQAHEFSVGDHVVVTIGDFSGATGEITHIHPDPQGVGDDLIRVSIQPHPPGNIVVRPHQLQFNPSTN